MADRIGPRDRTGYLPPLFGRRVVTSCSHDRQRGRAWFPGLPRGRRTLSGTPRPDAQVHHTASTAAPSVRVSHQQAAHRTTSAGTKREEKEEDMDHRGDRGELACGPPFIARGSTLHSAELRPSLRPVLGSTSFRGVSRSLSKGGVPSLRPPHAVHPPIGSELPHPFPSHQARGK